MSRKSRWDSDFWKAMKALSLILTIIAALLTILQLLGQVDAYALLILPIISFFTFPVPLYSIPLAFLVVIAIIIGLAYSGDKSSPVTISNPFYGADILDSESARYMALLCKTPRTPDSLKQSYYHEILERQGGYEYDYCLKELEKKGLIVFQNGKWEITQKALSYIAKYHGG